MYSYQENSLMKAIFDILEFIGDTEAQIEKLRQSLAKMTSFESYCCYKLIGGKLSQYDSTGITMHQLYEFIKRH